MGTRVSGQVIVSLKPKMGMFGAVIVCVMSRETLRSGWDCFSMYIIVNHLPTTELHALLSKPSTDSGGNEFAKMLNTASVASCIDEL
jgi:hypothetical protein